MKTQSKSLQKGDIFFHFEKSVIKNFISNQKLIFRSNKYIFSKRGSQGKKSSQNAVKDTVAITRKSESKHYSSNSIYLKLGYSTSHLLIRHQYIVVLNLASRKHFLVPICFHFLFLNLTNLAFINFNKVIYESKKITQIIAAIRTT